MIPAITVPPSVISYSGTTLFKPGGTGCHPSKEDERDCGLFLPSQHLASPAASTDFRTLLPPVWNQGNTEACTAYAITALACYYRAKQSFGYFEPSRVWTYWWERVAEGTTAQDAGANIRDGMRSMVYDGLCPMWAWPDSVQQLLCDPEATWKNLIYVQPDQRFSNGYLLKADPQWPAHHHKANGYRRVNLNPTEMVATLSAGRAIVFGTTLYDAFVAVGRDGIMKLPNVATERTYGGHALLICGYFYLGSTLYFIVRNSWGTGYGDFGYVYIPSTYFEPASGVPNWDGWTFTSMKA